MMISSKEILVKNSKESIEASRSGRISQAGRNVDQVFLSFDASITRPERILPSLNPRFLSPRVLKYYNKNKNDNDNKNLKVDNSLTFDKQFQVLKQIGIKTNFSKIN